MDMDAIMRAAVANAQAAVTAAKTKHTAAEATKKKKSWADMAETIEDALEHAGISGVDVQIDEGGYTRLVGEVDSEESLQTALKISEQFEITGLESNLEIVAPEEPDVDPDKAFAESGGAVTYTAVKGDSWWRIAATFYGDGTKWKELKRANGWPKMLHPGHEVKVPPKAELATFAE